MGGVEDDSGCCVGEGGGSSGGVEDSTCWVSTGVEEA